MKFSRFVMVLSVAAVFVGLSACKKNKEDEEVSPSFSGYLNFDIPAYVSAGQVITSTPYGAYRPDGGTYGYSWMVSPVMSKRDTTKLESDPETVRGTFTFTIPDTLGTLTFSATIYGTGYYSSSATHECVVVSPTKSLVTDAPKPMLTIVDERDGKRIPYIRKDGLDWTIANLKYAGGAVGYSDCDVMVDVTGAFYTWEEASKACPEGWRLPTVEEFRTFCGGEFEGVAGDLMVPSYFNEERMWEYWPEVNVTNKTLFAAVPAGYGNFDGEDWQFDGLFEYAAWWTADSVDDEKAAYVSLNVQSPDVIVGYAHKDYFGANVRCVR